jgi:hypothetical protein
MGYSRGLDHLGSFQLDLPGAVMVEQSDSIAEQHGHQVNLHLVEKPRSYVLLSGIRAAHHGDVLATRRGSRLLQGAFDAVGDEGVGRSPFLDDLLSSFCGEHETRCVEGGVIPPRHDSEVEGPTAHDDRPRGLEIFLFEGRGFAPGLAEEHPVMEPFTAIAHRLPNVNVWPGDKSVQRHRHVQDNLAHLLSPCSGLPPMVLRNRVEWHPPNR